MAAELESFAFLSRQMRMALVTFCLKRIHTQEFAAVGSTTSPVLDIVNTHIYKVIINLLNKQFQAPLTNPSSGIQSSKSCGPVVFRSQTYATRVSPKETDEAQ
jgi:hypothetical protein